MQKAKLVLSCSLALVLAACGGGGGNSGSGSTAYTAAVGPQAVPRFAAQVTFGDSLSDVGTYAVGAVTAFGGGKFTINGDASVYHPELIGKTWTELLAPVFGLPAPCAAQTGLQGDALRGLSVPVVNHPGCYGYAQGGARITDPVGDGNAATGAALGALTVPVVTQVANHLAVTGGRFQGNEIVFVMAGASDVLASWRQLSAGAYGAALAAGPDPVAQAQARAAYLFNNGPMAIATLAQAGSDLATIVRDQIVARGATRVVVNNVYDMAGTPAASWEDPTMRSLIGAMVEAFNRSLRVGVQAEARIGLVDVYALTRDEQSNPAFYGLNFNTTWTACGFNGLDGNALFCNVYNTWPGVDVSHYMYADSLQWTPYAQWLLARQVVFGMQWKGWL